MHDHALTDEEVKRAYLLSKDTYMCVSALENEIARKEGEIAQLRSMIEKSLRGNRNS
jgi:hypothetical protein